MFNLSRRSLVASAAALPALSVPAAAVAACAEPDPIFAAIEQWKEACAIEQACKDARDYENLPRLEQAAEAAENERINTVYAVFETVPTTLVGMRAKIDFAFSEDYITDLLVNNVEGEDTVRDFLDTLYEAAGLLAVRSSPQKSFSSVNLGRRSQNC